MHIRCVLIILSVASVSPICHAQSTYLSDKSAAVGVTLEYAKTDDIKSLGGTVSLAFSDNCDLSVSFASQGSQEDISYGDIKVYGGNIGFYPFRDDRHGLFAGIGAGLLISNITQASMYLTGLTVGKNSSLSPLLGAQVSGTLAYVDALEIPIDAHTQFSAMASIFYRASADDIIALEGTILRYDHRTAISLAVRFVLGWSWSESGAGISGF